MHDVSAGCADRRARQLDRSAQSPGDKPTGETGFSSSTARISTAGSPRSPATRSEKTTPTPSASSTAPCRRRTTSTRQFESKFGHLFYERQKFSHYIVAAEYRFIGEQVAGGPDWAIRNNGLMLHSQSPQSMGKDQDFPISVEVQLLGGLPNGKPRSTANMCSPGTQVFINGTMVKGHCLNSKSQTYAGDQWVRVEVEVRGGERLIAQGRGADRPRVREADDRRRRGQQVRPGGESRWDAPDRRLHRDPGREPPDRVPEDRSSQPLGLHGFEVAEVQELLRSPGRGGV